MDQEGSGAGKMAIPPTQRSICSNPFFIFFLERLVPQVAYMIIYASSLRITSGAFWKLHLKLATYHKNPWDKNPPFVMLNHLKPQSLLKKTMGLSHGLTPWDPFFWAWSDRAAAVAINHPENRAGWWRIEEEIEVKRSRSQDLERGRRCDPFFFDSESGPRGWYKKQLKLTRFFRIKKRF